MGDIPDFVARISEQARAFQEAKIVCLGVDLGLFDRLSEGPADATTLAAEQAFQLRGVEIVADALTALGYLEKDEAGRYRNTPDVDRYLVRGKPGSIAYITGHRNQMFRSWAKLDEVVRHGKQGREEKKATLADRKANRNFIMGMAEVSRGRLGPILDRLPLERARTFVDLGGGPGHYACEAVRRHAELSAVVVDLPLTVEVATEAIEAEGLSQRVTTTVCDFYREPSIPVAPADIVFISQVLHAEGPAENAALLAKARPIVKPGGRVVVVENLVGPDRVTPAEAAVFAVNMLAGTMRGRTYTAEEVSAWMSAAGFEPEPAEQVAPRTWVVQGRG